MKNPQYPDKENNRTKFYAFDWIGGGYNGVFARSKRDAIKLANEHLGDGTANLRVREDSVYKTDHKTWTDNLPLFD